ncbi:hypothetical protein LUZ62_000808 [Rhynchospora pubera]|uniref:Ribosomal protein S7 n=1 Tax=Rhynchospora pubera TaxID=906938 RepID=A0AAV8BKR3_9POAL|nr:hypothetical protein LUZ62_012252 [Rhynchospora pubera]KAJ4736046.1 hypothetical protein LUZ62_010689 [Rhynchospora pubera]KAJ4736823.1 hypothetical protein LUZ62_009363 [Rhynchospora pubera]KAJ4736838.1 hypothetical protein LUZ62_009354 [Rhynchospora pubera]KAJ4736888.1 hypothetical protein LUZ62_009238 [Rhynchospora pubera]
MSRRGTAKKKTAEFDPISCSRVVNMLVNRMMKHGKKSLAYQIFYRAALDIEKKTKENPVSILRQAILRVTPRVGVKTRRGKNGKTYKVPVAIPLPQGILLAIRWLLEASRKRSGTSMTSQLSSELIDAASKKRGKAIRKKEETHKRAEASRSFAHFR